ARTGILPTHMRSHKTMIDGRGVMRWLAAAGSVSLPGLFIRDPTPGTAPTPFHPTAPPPPAPLRAAPAPQSESADGLGHVALLMPISGKLSSAGISLREGFMTAYFQAPAAQRLHIR